MQRGTLQMPQAQKSLDKTLLYHTNTAGFSSDTLIPTENSFYFPTENKSYSTTVSLVSCGAQLGIRAWLSWGIGSCSGWPRGC